MGEINASLDAELAALKLLYSDWEVRSEDQQQADYHGLMWTIGALIDSGFTVEYPKGLTLDPHDTK